MTPPHLSLEDTPLCSKVRLKILKLAGAVKKIIKRKSA
jgi:hypothetical protein